MKAIRAKHAAAPLEGAEGADKDAPCFTLRRRRYMGIHGLGIRIQVLGLRV